MNLQLSNRYRFLLALSLLLWFGVPDYAYGGLLARLRARRCRAVTCQPSCCQPTCCQPVCEAPAAFAQKAGTACPAKMCQYDVISQTNDPITGECKTKDYLCQICVTGEWVHHDDDCKHEVPRLCSNSAHCPECFRRPIAPPIPADPPSDKAGGDRSVDQYPRYVAENLLQEGLPIKPDLLPGDNYTVEVRTVDGTEKKGIVFHMKLLDENQHPTDKEVLVHLDWLIPKNVDDRVPRRTAGTGYQTVDEQAEQVVYQNVRHSECVYAVYLKQGDKWRFYVVFLPKEGALK